MNAQWVSSISTAIVKTAAIGAVIALGVLLPVSSASASDPADLDGAYVLDTTGALDDGTGAIEQAIESLYDDSGVQAYVVFVDRFENPRDREEWINETADLNNLGNDNLLVAVAVDAKRYQLWQSDDLSLSTSELSQVASDSLVPDLHDKNWEQAAVSFLGAVDSSLMEGVPDDGVDIDYGFDPDTVDRFGTDSSSGDSNFATLFTVVIVLGIVGAIATAVVRSRADNSPGQRRIARDPYVASEAFEAREPVQVVAPAAPPQPSLAELDRTAGSLLVRLDDGLAASEQELGFAVASFGAAATGPFAAAIASARSDITEAFALRQKLDDTVADTDEERREWMTRIIALCRSAASSLDAQSADFDALREVEKDLPAHLTALSTELSHSRSAVSAAASKASALNRTYSASAVTSVANNASQAAGLVDLASQNVGEARALVAASKTGQAAVAVRTAESSLASANALATAVTALEKALADATTRMSAVIQDARQDIAEARASTLPALEPTIAAIESAIAYAESTGARDPLTSVTRVEAKAGELAAALANGREASVQRQKASDSLGWAVQTARARISVAEDFLASRRGGVGVDARTRLATAREHLDSLLALTSTDPVAALAEAQRSAARADESLDLAESDVGEYEGSNGSGAALAGGILAGLLLGGGGQRHNGFFGGGNSFGGGGFGGGFGSGFGGSDSGGGSFGGGGDSGSGGGHAGGGGGF